MSLFGVTMLTAVATVVLAVGAIVTGILAYLAFRKQSREVSAIEGQVADERELTRQQAELLRVQTGQLEVLRAQLEEQRKTSSKQAEVLELQAEDLLKSLEERERAADERKRSQAVSVTAWYGREKPDGTRWGAWLRNGSSLPIMAVQVTFFYVPHIELGSKWALSLRDSVAAELIAVMPPQQDRFIDIPVETVESIRDDRHDRDHLHDSVYGIGIIFTDSAGNRWQRDAYGTLKLAATLKPANS